MTKLDKIKAEFEGVEIEWRLHERICQLFAYVEASEAHREASMDHWPTDYGKVEAAIRALDKARRALGLE